MATGLPEGGRGIASRPAAVASQKCQMCCVIYAVSRMICLQSVYFSCLSAQNMRKINRRSDAVVEPGERPGSDSQPLCPSIANGPSIWPNRNQLARFSLANFYCCRQRRLLSFVTWSHVIFQVNYWNVPNDPTTISNASQPRAVPAQRSGNVQLFTALWFVCPAMIYTHESSDCECECEYKYSCICSLADSDLHLHLPLSFSWLGANLLMQPFLGSPRER